MLTALLILLVCGAATAQSDDPQRHFSLDGSFSLVLPDGWRQLTPGEARTLTKRPNHGFPPDMLAARLPVSYPYGNVTAWLADGFDGVCMTVGRVDGEPPDGEAALDKVREPTPGQADAGWDRQVTEVAWTQLGADGPAAIRCLARLQFAPGARPLRSLQLLIPTAGKTLLLGFRCWADEFDQNLPRFEATAATITVARAARGERSLGDELLYPALIGAFVGLLLVVLRRQAAA